MRFQPKYKRVLCFDKDQTLIMVNCFEKETFDGNF